MHQAWKISTITASADVGFDVDLASLGPTASASSKFANQRTLRLGSGANVKVFANGRAQLTGLKSPDGVDAAVDELACRLAPHAQATGRASTVAQARITLMNVNFHVGYGVSRHALHAALSDDPDVQSCVFEPLLSPALRVVLPHPVCGAFKSFIFESGNVMIFGTRTMVDAATAVDIVSSKIKSASKASTS